MDVLDEGWCLIFLEWSEEPFLFRKSVGGTAGINCVAAYQDQVGWS